MTTGAPSISVALACYNGERYLREQIESIIGQTRHVDEIVIVDDRSTDGTFELAKTLALQYEVIKLYQNDNNLGYRGNFMKACQLAGGDIIFFCDQDDVWSVEKVECVVERFSDADTLLVYHNATVTDNLLNPIGSLDQHSLGADVAKFSGFRSVWFSSLGFTQAIRRELLRYDPLWAQSLDHNKENQSLAHDQWFFFLAGLLGKVKYIDMPLARYRQHGANVDGWGGKRAFLARLRPRSRNAVANFADASDNRIEILQSLTQFSSDNSELSLARVRFEKVSKLYRNRSRIYERLNFLERAYWFLKCLREGYFRNLGRSEGGKSLLQDIIYGVYGRSLG